MIRQMGASEFYLNGQRILRLGTVSKDSKKEVLFNPNSYPYAFHFTGSRVQVLAVRYSFTKRNLYFNGEVPGNKTLVIQMLPANAAYKMFFYQKVHDTSTRFARVGFLLLLFLIHFFF